MRQYLLLIFIFQSFNSFAQKAMIDSNNKLKKLNIVSATGSSIVLQDGIINTEDSKSFMTFYNDKGLPVEERIANIKDRSGIIYKYQYGSKCRDFEKWEWLDFNGNTIDTVQIQQIIFDNNCRIKNITWIDSTGSVKDIRYLEFNDRGQQVKEVDKNSKGKITSFVLYTYPDSFIIDKKGFFGDSSFWYHSQEHFDNRGNLITNLSFDEKGVKSAYDEKSEYIYSGNSLTEVKTYNVEGKLTSKTTYTYNADGLVDRIVFKSVNSDHETITIYKYQKKN